MKGNTNRRVKGPGTAQEAVTRPPHYCGRAMVRVSEISRFLGQGADEVRDLLNVDDLPHAKVPGKTKPSVRVALKDLHSFLMRRWQGETAMRDFEVFRGEFWRSQLEAASSEKGALA